jgi:outer membrane protein assembly factor BamB
MRSPAIGFVLLLAACGGSGTQPRCGADADCGAGTVCEKPLGGERGVCVAPFAVSLTAPGAGGWAGLSTPVAAAVAAAASGRVLPAGAELLVDGVPAATLAREGSTASYRGTLDLAGKLSPAQLQRGTVSLAVAVARGTRDEVTSAPVPVLVDLVAPAITAASAGCGASACLRDGVLPIRATIDEARPDLLGVRARLDLDPARTVVLSSVGPGVLGADVDLQAWPFPALARDVQVTITATDQAGNQTQQTLAAPVTRVRWSYDAGAPVTSPAVLPDGRLVVGVSATTNQVRAVNADGTASWAATVGAGFVVAAPSVGASAIWIASQDGRLYAVNPATGAVLNPPGCNAGGALQGTPAIGGASETAFLGSGIGRLFAADAAGGCVQSLPTDAFSASPGIARTGLVLAATATATATATLRQYRYEGAFGENWAVQVGVNVQAPIAIDAADGVWTGSQDAKLNLTTPAGATSTVKTFGGSVQDSPVILAGGDVVVGDQARVLHRVRPDGTLAWSPEPVLDGAVLAPLVLAGGDAALLVPTAAGTLHAVTASGTVAWSGVLSAQPLRAGNIWGPPGQAFPTAYFGSADGKLYAVVSDGHLDTAAPWPKAHHDVRNTSNAAFPHP